MTESDKARLIAWGDELRAVHQRLRDALRVTQETLGSGTRDDATRRDLLLYCHGFCTALTGHHRGEDRELFPAIAAEHPELAETLRRLEDDHAMIAALLGGLRDATERGDAPERLGAHLEGIAAIMESHFQYEERRLLTVLDAMALDADPHDVFGPL